MSTIQSIIYNLWHFSDLIVIVHYVSVLCCNMFCLFAARKTRVFPASVHLGADSPSFLCLFWEIFTLRCVDFVLMLKQISFFCHQLSPSLSLSLYGCLLFFSGLMPQADFRGCLLFVFVGVFLISRLSVLILITNFEGRVFE